MEKRVKAAQRKITPIKILKVSIWMIYILLATWFIVSYMDVITHNLSPETAKLIWKYNLFVVLFK